MQYATWECASPDSALMLAGAVQMYKEFYHIPARAQTGVTSAKALDYQAGFESMQSLLLTALMDVDVTSQSAGTLDNLMTISFEKTVIDDELIDRVRRIISGLDIKEETYSVDIIMEVDHGDNFLTHDSTLDNYMDGWQPSLSDWNNYDTWKASPNYDIKKRAENKVKDILQNASVLLDKEVAKDLAKYMSAYEM